MIAIVLAAGYGTRLYPLTENIPKALLPVGSRPILGHLEKKLEAQGVSPREAILLSNHRFAAAFRDWVAQPGHSIPWIVLDDGSTSEQNRLGSMGDLAFAIKAKLVEEDLLVLGSDNLFGDNLAGFMKFARGKGGVTLGAVELPDRALASQYGVLSVDARERITEFTEKPADPASSLVSTAVYFFPRKSVRSVLEYVSSQKAADKLGSFICWLAARKPVFAYRFRGQWFDIGDIASYKHAQETFHS